MEKILEEIKAVLENIRDRKLTKEERIILHLLEESKWFYPKLRIS